MPGAQKTSVNENMLFTFVSYTQSRLHSYIKGHFVKFTGNTLILECLVTTDYFTAFLFHGISRGPPWLFPNTTPTDNNHPK